MRSCGQSILLLIAASFAAPCLAEEELQHITTGPILGRLSSDGIGVWARTSRASTFQVRYGLSQDKMDEITDPVPTRLNHDNTGWVHITSMNDENRPMGVSGPSATHPAMLTAYGSNHSVNGRHSKRRRFKTVGPVE